MSGIQTTIEQRQAGYGSVGLFFHRDGFTLPEFAPIEVVATKHIPGSNATYEQRLGFIPAQATFDVSTGSQADFRTLVELIGTRNTLTVNDMATALDVPREWILGESYAMIPNVKLVAITDPVSYIDGRVKCSAIFEYSTT